MIQAARRETPPDINVRPGVRAQLKYELSLDRQAIDSDQSNGIAEGIVEIFARPFAKFTLGATLAATAAIAFISASGLEVTEFATEREVESLEDFDASYFQDDWSEYL